MFWTSRLLAKTCTFWKVRKTYFIISCVTKSKFSYFRVKGVLFFFSMTVARPAPSDAPLVSTPLIGKAIPSKCLLYDCSSDYRDVCTLIGWGLHCILQYSPPGDYSRSTNFKMAALIEEDTILKSTQGANKFGVTLSKEGYGVFAGGINS